MFLLVSGSYIYMPCSVFSFVIPLHPIYYNTLYSITYGNRKWELFYELLLDFIHFFVVVVDFGLNGAVIGSCDDK